jgi:hypothetical protein
VRKLHVILLAGGSILFVGGGRADAYVGFGYRANEEVRVERCYPGLAWNYSVPFYIVGPNKRYHQGKCIKRDYRKKRVK